VIQSLSLAELQSRRASIVDKRPRAGYVSSELSPREMELLLLVAQALSDREIGARMGIANDTVRKTSRNVRDKIGVDNRVAMALYAVRKGLISA
jgi:DNA-binding CsgD family transcriptional regulator